jgi:DNA-directed RNA polymerase subunit RPC12/RpoP
MRNKTKGGKWETQYKCSKCGSQNLLVKNLEEFPVNNLDLSTVDYMIDVLPGVQIEMRFLKVIDELESLHFIDSKMSDSQKQAELTIVLQSAGINKIIQGNDVFEDLTLTDKKYFVEEMPTTVYEKISQWYKDNDYGVDSIIKHKCVSCGNEIEFEITPDNFFF